MHRSNIYKTALPAQSIDVDVVNFSYCKLWINMPVEFTCMGVDGVSFGVECNVCVLLILLAFLCFVGKLLPRW